MSSHYSPNLHSPTGTFMQSPLTAEEEAGMAGQGRTFEELLDAEVAVNLEKLREAARMGIPPAYRGVAYRYLLGVAFTDKSSEMTMEELQDKDFQLLQNAYLRMWGSGDDDDDGRTTASIGGGVGGVGGGVGGSRGSAGKAAAAALNTLRELLAFSSASLNGAAAISGGLTGPLLQASADTSSGDADAGGNDNSSSRNDEGGSRCPVALPFVYRGSSPLQVKSPAATLAAWEEAIMALRHSAPYHRDVRQRAKMESAMAALQVMYSCVSTDHVQLLVLFARQLDRVASTARDTFFTTHALFQLLSQEGNVLSSAEALQRHCADFLLLFRATLLPLYEHFMAEGVTTWEWVPSLLTSFFAGRMHHEDVFALWDYYLSDRSEQRALGLHPYACLATLSAMTELLIEAEKTELLYCLEHLPRIDPAAIMRKAVLIRESVYSKGLLT